MTAPSPTQPDRVTIELLAPDRYARSRAEMSVCGTLYGTVEAALGAGRVQLVLNGVTLPANAP